MLPGVLAGQYAADRMMIDLVRLCASAGARLIVGNVTGLNLEARQLLFSDRPEVPFDVLSIGIGSIPSQVGVRVHGHSLLAIKPMQTFLPRLKTRLAGLDRAHPERPLRIVVVGAGAGGTEIALCLPQRLAKWYGDRKFELTLVSGDQQLVSGSLAKTSGMIRQELSSRAVQIIAGRRVQKIRANQMSLDNGQEIDHDLAIWATGAVAPPLLSNLGLKTDGKGFLLTQNDLRVVGGHPIFAVGDTGTMVERTTPKAGVYAVRQGPILWRNIPRLLKGQQLEEYRPQRDFLSLLNLGDGRAVAEYRGLAFKGKWCWRLKDYIDGKFMDKYQDYQPMEMSAPPLEKATRMRCAGCGGKVGGSVLSRVLARLEAPQNEHVLVGLDEPDDAAVIQLKGGRPMTVTADFFTAPLDDPYIVGRIAALNAASDVFAIGAQPIAALALATIPLGSPRQQEELLYELLAGSMREFRQMETSLVGGHTIEGPTLTLGFTVLADQGARAPRTKRRIRLGDQLVLTKPLGSGILLAGHMQALCRAEWMEELLETMLLSNQHAASLLDRIEILGLTDITGFGLAGHLLEMLKPAQLTAKLDLASIPLLSGTADLLARGIESTLAPANRDSEVAIQIAEKSRSHPAYAAFFDPQTCGGLLMGVTESDVETLLTGLREQSDVIAAVIGEVVASSGSQSEILIV